MPTTAPQTTGPYRFGPFELDPRSGELRKSGVRVALQDQPLAILLALLAVPGQVVTREDLRHCLWRDDTFVDFEHGLNAAIKRLRDTLSDSADTPRFIETVPRRGYRFIGVMQGPLAVVVRLPQEANGVPAVAGKCASFRKVKTPQPSRHHSRRLRPRRPSDNASAGSAPRHHLGPRRARGCVQHGRRSRGPAVVCRGRRHPRARGGHRRRRRAGAVCGRWAGPAWVPPRSY